jgi:hypothetical protein
MDGDDDDDDEVDNDNDMFWNDDEQDGDVRCVRKMEALPVKLETVTLIAR